MTRVLLTGATGFVGGAALGRLLAAGHDVAATVRLGSALTSTHARLTVLPCDLSKLGEAATSICDFAPQAVIHSAWIGTENTNRDDPLFVAENLRCSLELLKLAKEAGCTRWIALGSQAEYSGGLDADITEDAPTFPTGGYGIGKLAACHMQRALCAKGGMSFAWLRLFASYGRDYKSSYVMPYLIDCFRRAEMPQLRTPNAVWDYIHVHDVADALLAVLEHPEADGIFNLGTGEGHTVGAIALMLAEMSDFADTPGLRRHIEQATDAPTRRVADISALKKQAEWQPRIDLNTGLRLCL